VYANTIDIGNLYENTWDEIWNNQAVKDLRMSLLTGEGMIEFCEKCSHRVLCKDHLIRILPRGNAEEGRPTEAATLDQEMQAEVQINA
jgi:MoaA/NifB/PqqE/SkfB family radical SAM enzyme